MMYASDFRFTARAALRGRWLMAVAVSLVAALLGSGGYNSSSSRYNVQYAQSPVADTLTWIIDPVGVIVAQLGMWLIAWGIAAFVIGSAIEMGEKIYYMRLIRGDSDISFSTLFARMDIFGRALGLRLVISLFTFLWTLLFIIPGIVAAYRYALAPYLMAQNPDMGIMEAIDESKRLMAGKKGELFWLHLSFFGWALLSLFTFGIGGLFLTPYRLASEAAFYLHVSGQMQGSAASA